MNESCHGLAIPSPSSSRSQNLLFPIAVLPHIAHVLLCLLSRAWQFWSQQGAASSSHVLEEAAGSRIHQGSGNTGVPGAGRKG